MNKQSIQIALAYMSVVIGGGFASGQEVLFFTGYGLIGIVGTLVSGSAICLPRHADRSIEFTNASELPQGSALTGCSVLALAWWSTWSCHFSCTASVW